LSVCLPKIVLNNEFKSQTAVIRLKSAKSVRKFHADFRRKKISNNAK
jgi:hypothetical protein